MPIIAAPARTIDFYHLLSSAGCGFAFGCMSTPVLVLQRVLETADGVLDLAFDLIGFAGGRLDRASELFHRSRDPILVHDQSPSVVETLRASGDRIGRV